MSIEDTCKEHQRKLQEQHDELARINGIASKALTISEVLKDQNLDTRIQLLEEWKKTVDKFIEKVEPKLDSISQMMTRNALIDRVIFIVISGFIGFLFWHLKGGG